LAELPTRLIIRMRTRQDAGSAAVQPGQIEAFLPKALEFLKNHLPPELVERVMASLPGLANLAGSGAK